MNQRVLSIFGINPFRVGSNEAFARELSLQLAGHKWDSVLCFLAKPPQAVRGFLRLPNVSLDILERPCEWDWSSATGFISLLRRWRPAIVHFHYTGFVSWHPWLARLSGSEKIFFTDHTSREEHYAPRRAPAWKRLAVRALNLPLSGVISVSNYGHRCVTALDLLPAGRFRRIYNGVDLSLFREVAGRSAIFRKRYGIPEDRLLVVQVSWIRPEKGVPEMLDASRLVVARNPNAHFAIVGEGPYRSQYMDRAEEMGLSDHVTWTGLVENPFAMAVYEAADVVCQPSRWEEAFGWVITEAMASSKPVVATRVGGIPEIVEEGESGFLVDRGDSLALAERILLLLADPSLRERMGRTGRRKVEEKFDLTKTVAELLEFYGI